MPARVAFPVLFATLRLHLDKGKRWNPLEHLLLHAVCLQPRSAPELVDQSNLPRRLVIEVMIRLMRVGWVELISSKEHAGFQATVAGQRVARYESLPAVTRPLSKRASFVIDQVSGTVFRARDLMLYNQARLDKVKATEDVVVLSREVENPRPQIDEIISTLLEDDEQCKGVEPSGGKLIERYAIVRVDGEAVEGLPARAPSLLKQRIKDAVAGVAAALPQDYTTQRNASTAAGESRSLEIVFNYQDLILGGVAHKVILETALRKARSRFLVHSTFVNAERFALLLPLMKDAARRGVRVDILWGKSQEKDGANTTAAEVEKCRALLQDDYLRERVRFHSFTTNSHAKLLLADNGRGQMAAVIGSCNWFSTGFERTSVLIPARTAMDARGIDVTLLYGRTSGAQDGRLARSLVNLATEQGIQLRQIHHPRLHAKFLAWDDDSIVVTSQNWLSADPPDSYPYAEIGVYLSSPGIARELVDLTDLALKQP